MQVVELVYEQVLQSEVMNSSEANALVFLFILNFCPLPILTPCSHNVLIGLTEPTKPSAIRLTGLVITYNWLTWFLRSLNKIGGSVLV